MYYIYKIDCLKPDHVYIGFTQNYSDRKRQQRTGHGASFVRRFGFASMELLRGARTLEEARRIEKEYVIHFYKAGKVAAGAGYTMACGYTEKVK